MYIENTIEYSDSQTTFNSYYVRQKAGEAQKPTVIIFADWYGISDFTRSKAKKLADLGYLGVAADLYGHGKVARDQEEAAQLMNPLVSDRLLLRQRVTTLFAEVKKTAGVKQNAIAAMGFCFGGTAALDLARSGVDLIGSVSFHGRLTPPNAPQKQMKAKILVLHGYKDPMVPPEDVTAFAKEMTDAKVDWEIDMYGNAMHSFTNPKADSPENGMLYNAQTDARAWAAMKHFFSEIFGT